MHRSLLLLALAIAAHAGDCISSPCSGSTNFPRDLYGPVDTRPNCYGHAEAAILPITFKPPAGYRVKILGLRGDLVSWALGKPAQGKVTGVLLGFSTTGPEGSVHADWLGDNTPLYVQDVLRNKKRTRFDYPDVDTILEPDHVLNLKIATWLNETGVPYHLEATASITYRFIPM